MKDEPLCVGIVGAPSDELQLQSLLARHPLIERETVAIKIPANGNVTPPGQSPSSVEYSHQRCNVILLLSSGIPGRVVSAYQSQGIRIVDLSSALPPQTRSPLGRSRSPATSPPPISTTTDLLGGDRPAIQTVPSCGFPELYRTELRTASWVTCPSGEVTASILGLAPLLRQGLVELDSLSIDSKVGSRSDRTTTATITAVSSLSSVHAGNLSTLERESRSLAGRPISLQYTRHDISAVRGTIATVYAKLRDPGLVDEDLLTVYTSFYRQSAGVNLLPSAVEISPSTADHGPYCQLRTAIDRRTQRVAVTAAVNTSSSAALERGIQCLNAMHGWPDQLGLSKLSGRQA